MWFAYVLSILIGSHGIPFKVQKKKNNFINFLALCYKRLQNFESGTSNRTIRINCIFPDVKMHQKYFEFFEVEAERCLTNKSA